MKCVSCVVLFMLSLFVGFVWFLLPCSSLLLRFISLIISVVTGFKWFTDSHYARLKSGDGEVISSHILLGLYLFIDVRERKHYNTMAIFMVVVYNIELAATCSVEKILHKLGAIYCIYSETFLILASPLQQFNDMGSSSREMYVPTYEINDNGPGGTLFGRSETLFRRSKPSNVRVHVRARECARARVRLWEVKMILITRFMGLTWGPSGGRQDPGAWAPCGPHDLCFLWEFITLLHTGPSIYQRTSFLHILSMVN